MKKILGFFIFFIILLIIVSAYLLKTAPPVGDQMQEEKNESSTNIEDENGPWNLLNNPEVGFYLQYPSDVILLSGDEYKQDQEKTYLKVDLKPIGEKINPMDLGPEAEVKNIEALSNGEFGLESDWPLVLSEKVKSVGFLFAQDFMVLGRFEVCDVTLERKLLFYFNNNQITITLFGPVDKLRETMSEYFTNNPENCQEEKIWDFDKQDAFYQTLVNGNGSEEIQKFYDLFDQMAETIVFAE